MSENQMPPPGSVIITTKDLYDDVQAIKVSVGNTERNLAPLPAQVAEHDAYLNQLREAGLPSAVTTLQIEVSQLRTRWAWLAGLGAAAAFAAGLVGALLPLIVK